MNLVSMSGYLINLSPGVYTHCSENGQCAMSGPHGADYELVVKPFFKIFTICPNNLKIKTFDGFFPKTKMTKFIWINYFLLREGGGRYFLKGVLFCCSFLLLHLFFSFLSEKKRKEIMKKLRKKSHFICTRARACVCLLLPLKTKLQVNNCNAEDKPPNDNILFNACFHF